MDKMVSLRDGKKVFVRHFYKPDNHKTLMYLHGGPGEGCENFSFTAHLLSKEINVILFDQRGVFRSQAVSDDEPLNVDILVDDIEDLRKTMGIDDLYLLGHSYGGFLALIYALKYPDKLRGIIYENPGWSILDAIKTVHRNTIPFIREGGDDELADKIETALTASNNIEELSNLQDETPEKYRAKAYYNKPWSEEMIAYYQPIEVTDEQIAYTQKHADRILADDINTKSFLSSIKEIKCPSLLLRGDHDPVMSTEHQQYFHENAPHGYVEIIKDCGHSIHNDAPHEFCKVVKSFLQAL